MVMTENSRVFLPITVSDRVLLHKRKPENVSLDETSEITLYGEDGGGKSHH